MKRFVPLAAAAFALAIGFSGTASALTVTNLSDAPTAWAAAFGSNPVNDTSTLATPGVWADAPKSQAGNWAGVYRSVFDNEGVAGVPNNSAYIGLKYWSVGPAAYYGVGGNEARMTFAVDQTSLSFLWGSIDNYNAVEFWLNGALSSTVVDSDIAPSPTNPAGRGASYVRITGVLFDEIRFKSSSNAFEFSNLTTTPVPIPAAVWLLGSGLIGLFGVARRKKVITA